MAEVTIVTCFHLSSFFLNDRRILHSWLDEYDDTPFAFCIEEERDLDRPWKDND
jgi:hypothetical protein